MKLKKKRFNTELRHHFFRDRIINLWNSLDEKKCIICNTELFQEWTGTITEETQADGSCIVICWLKAS